MKLPQPDLSPSKQAQLNDTRVNKEGTKKEQMYKDAASIDMFAYPKAASSAIGGFDPHRLHS